MGEDFTEDGVGGDGAGDFAEPVEAFADVLVEEVAAQAVVKAVDGTGDGVAGNVGQGGGLDNEATQCLDITVALGADGYDWCSLGQEVIEFAPGGKIVVKVGFVEYGNEGLAFAMV